MLRHQFVIYSLTALFGSLLLLGCNSGDTTSSSSDTEETQLEINVARLLDTKECERCNLRNADLIDAILDFSELSNSNLSNANLLRADLHQADFYHADLSNANLSNANMKEANLGKADLAGADLSDAVVTGAYFFAADLMNATWTDGVKCLDKTCAGKAYD